MFTLALYSDPITSLNLRVLMSLSREQGPILSAMNYFLALIVMSRSSLSVFEHCSKTLMPDVYPAKKNLSNLEIGFDLELCVKPLMISEIPSDKLTLDDVPYRDAEWIEIEKFALTLDGYRACGSFEKCAEIANSQNHDSLLNLRICLFFEQRRWRHFCEEPDDVSMDYIRGMVDKIRAYLAG